MLIIRLRRMGGRNNPLFRVVVAERRSKLNGRPTEELGNYNPRTQPATFHLNMERIEHWIGQGAQISATVQTLIRLTQKGAMAPAVPAAKPPVAQPAPEPVAAAVAAPAPEPASDAPVA